MLENCYLNIMFFNELPLISNQNETYLFLCKKILWILYPHLTTVLLVNLESEKCIESEKQFKKQSLFFHVWTLIKHISDTMLDVKLEMKIYYLCPQ